MGCCGNIKPEKGEIAFGEEDAVRPSMDISKIIAARSTEENETKRSFKVLTNNFPAPIMKQSVLSEQTGTEDDIELMDLPLPEESYMENQKSDAWFYESAWNFPYSVKNAE